MSKRNRMLRNRKGEDMLVDFFVVLAFALVIILFFILFSYENHKAQKDSEAKFANKDTNYMLESFLRSPAVDIDSKKTVSQIIMEDSVTQDYKQTTDLFNRYFSQMHETDGFTLTIETAEDNTELTIERTGGLDFFDKIGIFISTKIWVPGDDKYARTYIPGPDGSKIHIILEKAETVTSG
jgi:uncharacterized protein YjaZ